MTLLIEDAAACVMYIWPNIETTKKRNKNGEKQQNQINIVFVHFVYF